MITPMDGCAPATSATATRKAGLFVVDRLKELIKDDGRQVAPAELEAILLTHPASCRRGGGCRPDEKPGEVPKAFVVLRTLAVGDDITKFVADRVAPYKRIRLVEFVSEIPQESGRKDSSSHFAGS